MATAPPVAPFSELCSYSRATGERDATCRTIEQPWQEKKRFDWGLGFDYRIGFQYHENAVTAVKLHFGVIRYAGKSVVSCFRLTASVF